VVDGGGGELAELRGSTIYDDEGTPMGKTQLLTNGVITGRLHTRQTAGYLNEPATGNARTMNFHLPPACRMTNTYILPGESSFPEMLAGLRDGLYLGGHGSGNTVMDMFTLNAEWGRRIRNGKLAGWVLEVVLTGNVFETLLSIDAIGDDLQWSQGGNCGKSIGHRLQYPLSVAMGSPHIRIRNVLVTGR